MADFLASNLRVHHGKWAAYSSRVLSDLNVDTIPQRTWMFMGTEVTPLRRFALFSDEGVSYSYSGTCVKPSPLLPWMRELMSEVHAEVSPRFNSILVNVYPDGNASISAHRDAGIVHDDGVYAISFGADRKLVFRCDGKRVGEAPMKDGDGVHMVGVEFQRRLTHEVPKMSAKKCSTPRVSLTFRTLE